MAGGDGMESILHSEVQHRIRNSDSDQAHKVVTVVAVRNEDIGVEDTRAQKARDSVASECRSTTTDWSTVVGHVLVSSILGPPRRQHVELVSPQQHVMEWR